MQIHGVCRVVLFVQVRLTRGVLILIFGIGLGIGIWTEENLRGNSITLVKLARTLSLIIAVIRESKRLGAIVTTLIPCLATSRVRGRVSDAIAPFEALYATIPFLLAYLTHSQPKPSQTHKQNDRRERIRRGWGRGCKRDKEIPWPGCPSKAADEATIIITPRSPSEFRGVERAMCGSTWRIRSMVPRTLTFITKSKSERENGSRLRSRILERKMEVSVGVGNGTL